jgi:hypothetical protein
MTMPPINCNTRGFHCGPIVVPENEMQCVQARSYLRLVSFQYLITVHTFTCFVRWQEERAAVACAYCAYEGDDVLGRDAV